MISNHELELKYVFKKYKKRFFLHLCGLMWQATRETLKRHITEFGELLRKDNEVGVVIDGQVRCA